MTESFSNGYHYPGCELPDGEYVLSAHYLNQLYDDAIKNFNIKATNWEEGSYPYTYARAFWNGYGAAVAGIRDHARSKPVDPTVQ
jgi:hypothetical protein